MTIINISLKITVYYYDDNGNVDNDEHHLRIEYILLGISTIIIVNNWLLDESFRPSLTSFFSKYNHVMLIITTMMMMMIVMWAFPSLIKVWNHNQAYHQ